jgi:hypothetical protein
VDKRRIELGVPAIGPDADKPIKVIKEVDEDKNNKNIRS